MRWLLIPFLFLAFFAPPKGCAQQFLVKVGTEILVPPLPMGSSGAWLGTDIDGRDNACLLSRGVRSSLEIGLTVLLLAVLPGVLLGLLMGWRGITVGLYAEIFILAGLIMLLGNQSYRWVLALGVALFVARLVAVRVRTVLLEPFIEGARAMGGSDWHILSCHVLPHLVPVLPSAFASGLSISLLWMAELAALGYFETSGYWVDFGSGFENIPMKRFLPLNPDLAQMIASARYEWLALAEQLFFPAMMLILMTLAFSDLGRALSRTPKTTQIR